MTTLSSLLSGQYGAPGATGAAGATGSAGVDAGPSNLIINGAMEIDQRNSGAEMPASFAGYPIDRFAFLNYSSLLGGASFKAQQNLNAITPPDGFAKYLGVEVTTGTANSYIDLIIQPIEGYNIANLNWGTADAKSVTVSFKVYSSLTGDFGGILTNVSTEAFPFYYNIPTANTWTNISQTIPGPTSGTFNNGNGTGISLGFTLAQTTDVGKTPYVTYGATPNGAWQSGAFYNAVGGVQVTATTGAKFYVTGVKVEAGNTATPFSRRLYADELALCQRYFQTGLTGGVGYGTASSRVGGPYTYPVPMRANPTYTANTFTNVSLASTPATQTLSTSSVIRSAQATSTGTVSWTETFTLGIEL